jgi:hypothetical protein
MGRLYIKMRDLSGVNAGDLLRSFEAHGLFETVTVLTQHSGSI